MIDYMQDRIGDSLSEMDQRVCWECLALMQRFVKFKQQVHSAQDRMKNSLTQVNPQVQCLSSLEMKTKTEFDRIYFELSISPVRYDNACATSKPRTVKGVTQGHGPATMIFPFSKLQHGPLTPLNDGARTTNETIEKNFIESSYIKEFIGESGMSAYRETGKRKKPYVDALYKCELCILHFDTEQQVEDHFITMHLAKPNQVMCQVCYICLEQSDITEHVEQHYYRYVCKLCGNVEHSLQLAQRHAPHHISRPPTHTARVVQKITERPKPSGRPPSVVKTIDSVDKVIQHDVDRPSLEQPADVASDHVDVCKSEEKTTPLKPDDNQSTSESHQGLKCSECDSLFDPCNKSLPIKQAMEDHINYRRFGKASYECPVCGKTKTQLAMHEVIHSADRSYECNMCHQKFKQCYLEFAQEENS